MSALKFTNEQRLIIALLCDALRAPSERQFQSEDIKLIMSAIYGGHDWAIEYEMNGMFPDKVDTKEDVEFVADVLDMWSFIELSWKKFDDHQKQEVRNAIQYLDNPTFIGFDGNNETNYMSIAQMFVDGMNRFTEFKGRSLNSHSHKVASYRIMLTKWPAIRKSLARGDISVPQMINLLSRH